MLCKAIIYSYSRLRKGTFDSPCLSPGGFIISASAVPHGHRVAGVTQLNNRNGEPSRAVGVTFEGCSLLAEVWIASTPFQVAPFAASVRRCTKCQAVGHTKSQCRAKDSSGGRVCLHFILFYFILFYFILFYLLANRRHCFVLLYLN